MLGPIENYVFDLAKKFALGFATAPSRDKSQKSKNRALNKRRFYTRKGSSFIGTTNSQKQIASDIEKFQNKNDLGTEFKGSVDGKKT